MKTSITVVPFVILLSIVSTMHTVELKQAVGLRRKNISVILVRIVWLFREIIFLFAVDGQSFSCDVIQSQPTGRDELQ